MDVTPWLLEPDAAWELATTCEDAGWEDPPPPEDEEDDEADEVLLLVPPEGVVQAMENTTTGNMARRTRMRQFQVQTP